MRIIGGKYRGRIFNPNKKFTARPTTDLAKEALFNILANRYDFSGGQIDNIIRKNEIYEIIHGIKVDFKNILEFCNSELLQKNNSIKVGFTKS